MIRKIKKFFIASMVIAMLLMEIPFASADIETQEINLDAGWNLMSLYVEASSMEVADIMEPLVSSGQLIMVITGDNRKYAPSNNMNQIGTMTTSEAYKIKVTEDVTLAVEGEKVSLPKTLSLKAGSNFFPHPTDITQDAMCVLEPLINSDNFNVATDLKGGYIYEQGDEWINTIIDFVPGGGYLIHIKDDTTFSYTGEC